MIRYMLDKQCEINLKCFVLRWDMAKYPIKQSLKNLSEIIAKQVDDYF